MEFYFKYEMSVLNQNPDYTKADKATNAVRI